MERKWHSPLQPFIWLNKNNKKAGNSTLIFYELTQFFSQNSITSLFSSHIVNCELRKPGSDHFEKREEQLQFRRSKNQ